MGFSGTSWSDLVDSVSGLPVLDAPVPDVVDQLADVVMLFDTMVPDVELVIEVPKIILDQVSQRSSLRAPQLAEQLVEVPVLLSRVRPSCRPSSGRRPWHWPGALLVARGSTLVDHVGPTGGRRAHATVAPARGTHRQPRAVKQILGAAPVPQIQDQFVDVEAPVVDVPVTVLHMFQQFYEFDILVPQIQFIDGVLDTAVVPQRQVRTV